MRGGELDYNGPEYRAIKQLTYTGQSTYYDNDSWERAENEQLQKHIQNLNDRGSTNANGYSMTVKGDKLVVDSSLKWECSIPVLNDYLEGRNLPKINYNLIYQSQSKPAPTPPTRDKLLSNSKYTFQNMFKDPLRDDFTEAKKWFNTEFLKVIVPAAGLNPVIKVGANPIQSTELMDSRYYTYADSIINFYNYANSNSKYRKDFKKNLIEIFHKFRDVSEFEKNKSTYKVLLMDDEVTKKLIEEYDSLNMVDKIISKYDLIEKIMEVVAKYSKEELEAAKVKAFNKTAPSGEEEGGGDEDEGEGEDEKEDGEEPSSWFDRSRMAVRRAMGYETSTPGHWSDARGGKFKRRKSKRRKSKRRSTKRRR
jgi:hypothetical protein